MAALLKEVTLYYKKLEEIADPRVEKWPLMSSPLPVLILIIIYQYFFRSLGPKIMENRPPINVKNAMIIYNVFQILLSGWFVEESLRTVWLPGKYNILNQPVDYSDEPFPVYVAFVCYIFFLSKILDLLDTVFMILRKKTNQQSFLHTYHHSIMVLVIWLGVKFMAGGNSVIFGTINAFVHTVMYSYYLLTLIRPEYKKSVWWKRHLTELQLVQFVITMTLGVIYVLQNNDYKTRLLGFVMIPQDAFFLVLFWDFYKKTYLSKNKRV
uniref:Elongation of very long chain fatty acids protein n=1 Tax=Clastoptera arizonana TaxID=38151 RepID=A0A1B6D3I0_9HEMI